jgi:serine/threonine-protein kinase
MLNARDGSSAAAPAVPGAPAAFHAGYPERVPKPGDVLLGKYRVERVIGVGGMGAVVAARHLQLDERVAVKVLLPQMLANDELVQRFLREARLAIKIRSEHCVRVLDVGTLETGVPYMVMEYLEGEDLAAIVEKHRPLPIAATVDWVLQAGEALAEAHALGIVHRDLKPANLFLTRRADGTPCVKVLDFGISKQTASGADAGVTTTQAVLGSPRYMSPEQMRSTRDVDVRADVWALGAVVHELVAGQPPFDAETMTALCAAILQDPPRPIRSTRVDVPPQLEAVVANALEKDRDRRFPNIGQFAAALAPFGSPSARASAERIARVLGLPIPPAAAMTAPVVPFPHLDPSPSNGAFWRQAPMSVTTGGSGSIASDVPRRGPGGAIAVGVFLLVAVAGGVGLVAFGRHSPAGRTATQVVPTQAPPNTAQAPDVPPLPAPGQPGAPAASPDPSVAASPPASADLPASSAAPSGRAADVPAPTGPASNGRGTAPAASPHRPPPTRGRPPAEEPKQPTPPNTNPFGDDRKG